MIIMSIKCGAYPINIIIKDLRIHLKKKQQLGISVNRQPIPIELGLKFGCGNPIAGLMVSL